MDKQELRLKYKNLRRQFSKNSLDTKSIEIANSSLKLPIWNRIFYHIFLPIEKHNEINTEFLLQILQGRDKRVVISKSEFTTGEMTHFLLDEHTRIRINSFGIPEPEEGIEISPEKIDVVFVPLLAFDKNGNRIGYGKGFYDRFLSKCKSSAIFIGLSLFEPEEQISTEPTDIPLHYCITPQRIYSFG